ncbi:hypothetical protein FYK55_00105 [Roseiconus nitratireducens]|uniref:DUF6798 domain-containing protein n=1 Tax=Roseiconus nitratireducens TaxID=2605748 RepID=A0A5M6DIA8_9BACT|nr:hypothetical protein FYK55_00105 [Roseiconus nitratireducens]
MAVFFLYAGDPVPAVNEAHYLVKAKNFWDPAWCSNDLLAASGKAHVTYYVTFGWLTRFCSLATTAWIGRLVGWALIALGLQRCCRALRLPRFYSLGVAVLWIAGVEYGNLAGEWVIGGIEAKVPAYGLVLIGMSEVMRRHWSRAWVWFGAASAFHVLTGGWAVVAAIFSFLVCERWLRPKEVPPKPFFTWGLWVGGALSLLGLAPAILLTMSATPAESVLAAKIYTYVRLRHHLLPSDFPWSWYLRHGVLVGMLLVWMGADRKLLARRPAEWMALGAVLIAGGGLLVGTLQPTHPDLTARLLRYYWFRLTDALVPLVVAFIVMQKLAGVKGSPVGAEAVVPDRAAKTGGGGRTPVAVGAAALTLLFGLGLFGWSSLQRVRLGLPPSTSHRLLGIHPEAGIAEQHRSHADWVAVCDWVRVAMPEDEVFLTPRHQQTFKWYAERAEVVNWKEVPQDAVALLEWRRRFEEIFPERLGTTRVSIQYTILREIRQRYGARFMVVDRRVTGQQLPLVKVYPVGSQTNATYAVYELPY